MYVPGHKCSGQLYSLTVLPEEEMETEEFLDVDESLVDLDSSDLPTPQISLNALTGMAKRLGCNIRTTCPLAVTVAGGNHLVSDGECKDFKWHFENTIFTTDIMLLPLGGCDMVLGIQWLATLGDIKCNFKELRMEFKYNGKGVALRGTQKTNVEWMGDVFSMQMEGSTTVIDPKIQEVLAAYEDVFDVPTALPPLREHDHRIPLIEGVVPVNIRPYKHPPAQKDTIESMVKELLDAGVIKKSHNYLFLTQYAVSSKEDMAYLRLDFTRKRVRLIPNMAYPDYYIRPIVFNEELTSEEALSCEPTVSPLNDNKIDFRISFDESDDQDYTPTVSYFDDLDYVKDFENEFSNIVYNDDLTSKSDFLTEPIVSPQHVDEFDLKDKTSLSECDGDEQNVLYLNDLFPFNVIYPDDSKSDKDNDDDKIDIEYSSGDLSIEPLPNVINTDDDAYAHGSNKLLETSHDTSNKFFKTKTFIKELNVNTVA
ncbi:retrovirus-related pol polyprotein from transposon TNT 1-94 [Tanacetum coccineum]